MSLNKNIVFFIVYINQTKFFSLKYIFYFYIDLFYLLKTKKNLFSKVNKVCYVLQFYHIFLNIHL